MNGKTRRSPALIEMIILILCLSIALTVVVQVFAQVFLQDRVARRETNALIAMQDITETLKADPQAGQSTVIRYDKDFISRDESGEQTIEVSITPREYGGGTLYEIVLRAYSVDEGEIASIRAAAYVSKGGDA